MSKTLIECGNVDVIWDGDKHYPVVMLLLNTIRGYEFIVLDDSLDTDRKTMIESLSSLISAFEVIIRELKDAEVAERLAQEEYLKNG